MKRSTVMDGPGVHFPRTEQVGLRAGYQAAQREGAACSRNLSDPADPLQRPHGKEAYLLLCVQIKARPPQTWGRPREHSQRGRRLAAGSCANTVLVAFAAAR